MSNRPTTARRLREVLVHRIASGQYPIGAQLPGTRDLAVEIGANRAGEPPVIVLAFHVDPQSAQYIRSPVLAAGCQPNTAARV